MKISSLILALLFVICLTLDEVAAKNLGIKVIVPYAVGTATNLIFRAYGQAINRQSAGSIKVLNRPMIQ